MSFFEIIRELLFRLKLYCFGVNFYEVKNPTETEVITETVYKLHDDSECIIHLNYSRVPCKDFLLKKGKLVEVSYNSYIITANIENCEEPFALDHRQFFFNSRYNNFGLPEARILELIGDIYIDFLKSLSEGQAPGY